MPEFYMHDLIMLSLLSLVSLSKSITVLIVFWISVIRGINLFDKMVRSDFDWPFNTFLFAKFRSDPVTNHIDAVITMPNCFESIRIWMAVDQLKLNDNKTEIILIGWHN